MRLRLPFFWTTFVIVLDAYTVEEVTYILYSVFICFEFPTSTQNLIWYIDKPF